LEDGHISIPQEIIDKLNINRGSKLRVTVAVEKEISKDKILSYAGLLSDLTEEERKRFDETVKRRSLFGNRKAEI
jgi:bifunctional DNA-binding transcriptional regulator/antitoxin component of YhaV-PrlF toxin-antitoxin module